MSQGCTPSDIFEHQTLTEHQLMIDGMLKYSSYVLHSREPLKLVRDTLTRLCETKSLVKEPQAFTKYWMQTMKWIHFDESSKPRPPIVFVSGDILDQYAVDHFNAAPETFEPRDISNPLLRTAFELASARQEKILKLIAAGKTRKDVSECKGIPYHTVCKDITRLRYALEMHLDGRRLA